VRQRSFSGYASWGDDIAYDLVTNTPWSVIADTATLLGKDIADKLQAAKESVGGFIDRGLAAAKKTLRL
jgi:hypothetical protein